MLRNFREMIQSVPLENEEAAIEEIAQRLVREGLGSAAIVFLETSKPVSFLTGQAALVATPFIGGFIEPLRLERYVNLFSNRDFLERLIRRIEELENERAGAPKKKANDQK